jgi:hypothetical protein
VDLLEDLSDIEEAGPSAAPAAVPTKKMPTVFYAEVAKFSEFLKLFPPHCIVAGCGGRMVEKSMQFIGLTLSLHLECPHGHLATWQSAKEGTFTMVSELNDKAVHAGLCCGWGYTGYKEWAVEFDLPEPTEKAWYALQEGIAKRQGWCAAVLKVAEERMASVRAEIIARDGEEGTTVYLDARFDSSREGYHGTVLVLNMLTGKVLHVVTLTRVETGSAWKTEDAAVRLALEDLAEAGVNIVEAVHDDKTSVDGILTEYGIWSSKDLWHKCKSLCSKFREELVKVRREAIAAPGGARAACDLKTMTVDKLKAFLKEHNLDLKGRKDALVARVWTFLEKVEEEVEEDSRLLWYPELEKHGVADKLKTHIYTCCKARAVTMDDDPSEKGYL